MKDLSQLKSACYHSVWNTYVVRKVGVEVKLALVLALLKLNLSQIYLSLWVLFKITLNSHAPSHFNFLFCQI